MLCPGSGLTREILSILSQSDLGIHYTVVSLNVPPISGLVTQHEKKLINAKVHDRQRDLSCEPERRKQILPKLQ